VIFAAPIATVGPCADNSSTEGPVSGPSPTRVAPRIDVTPRIWSTMSAEALVATVLLTWYGLFRRRTGPWALAFGGLGWLAVLGLVLAAVAPGGSYLAAGPALAAALTGLIAVTAGSWWVRLLAVGIGGLVAVVILAPTVYLFFPALGLETGAVAALFAVMLGLALLPAIELVYPAIITAASTANAEVPRRSGHRWSPTRCCPR